ncbi:hypothetical protein MMC15_006267 [Xylographa vitiligo]|nr:hypothetical protein [Xylographa vitiligo]
MCLGVRLLMLPFPLCTTIPQNLILPTIHISQSAPSIFQMHLSAPLLLLVLSLSTFSAASYLPNDNLQARDEPAEVPEVPPPKSTSAPTPEAAPPSGAAPVPPPEAAVAPEAAQNNGGDAGSSDDNSDPGDGGGFDERDLSARGAYADGEYADGEDELYVRDE